MYQINDCVIYSGSGVCKIVDIRNERFDKTFKRYYVLVPIYDVCDTKIFVPVGSENEKFKHVLSADEIPVLLEQVSQRAPILINDEKQREQFFDEALKNGDRVSIIKMICQIHEKKREKKNMGLRMRISDERILKQAENVIDSEFAFALGIKTDEVGALIRKTLNV